jgi:hypothetical protein
MPQKELNQKLEKLKATQNGVSSANYLYKQL